MKTFVYSSLTAMFMLAMVPNVSGQSSGASFPGGSSNPGAFVSTGSSPVVTPATTDTFSSRSSVTVEPASSNQGAMSALFHGRVLSVNQASNTITVRNPDNGSVATYLVDNKQTLQNLKEGDTVQIFAQ